MNIQNRYKILLTMVVGFLFLHWLTGFQGFIYVSLTVGTISLFSARIADFIVWLWMKIALVLGWVNSRILLSLIFFLFLWPFSWFYKLGTKNPLGLKRTDQSTYKERNHTYVASDLENSW